MKYNARRHTRLMAASEYALHHAAASGEPAKARIARQVITDSRIYRTWENVHAELLYPVASHHSSSRLMAELRQSQMRLVHRRALFRYLDAHNVVGEKRRRLLRRLHRTLDFEDAILKEHRQFMFAVSSRISSQHLTEIMNDDSGESLVHCYEAAYDRYFALKCELALARTNLQVAMIRPFLADAQEQLLRTRHRLQSERPSVSGYDFDTQEALSRSGRYRAINYLNA